MQIRVNGTIDELPDNSTIRDILANRTLREDIVIVLVNGEIIKREEWGNATLSPDDNLEIVRIVGGG